MIWKQLLRVILVMFIFIVLITAFIGWNAFIIRYFTS
jgi:hypothetical protein